MSDIIILKAGEVARMDPTQSGFAHGFGIFETIKLSAGRLCFWQAHWQRLVRSVTVLNLEFDAFEASVLGAIRELVRAEGLSDGTVKVSLLRNGAGVSCYVYARPSMSAAGHARLQLTQDGALNEHSLLAGHKTHNYMENLLLLEAARSAGFTDVLRVNTAGDLTETAVANVFFIQAGRLCTPALSTGALPGVIRAEVLRVAQVLSIPVAEGRFSVAVLQGAEAVFVTNSSVGIQQVDTVDTMNFSGTHAAVDSLKPALADAEARNSILLLDD
jgi:branched-subunit amino acid aminotransferase/4-amino-4-deoxychorismate lyase